MKLFCLLLFFIFIRLTLHKASSDSSTYTAGVVQYKPMTIGLSSKSMDEGNVMNYYNMMELAFTNKIDIIIFPECGLTAIPKNIMLPNKPPSFIKYNKKDNNEDYVRSVQEYSDNYRFFYRDDAFAKSKIHLNKIICRVAEFNRHKITSKMTALEILSCSARKFNMYVVATHYEYEYCDDHPLNCPSDGFYLYSTSLVFDRRGRLIARYRKHTKFDEPWIDVPQRPKFQTFTTHFNVTFGLLIGLDVFDQNIIDLYDEDLDVYDMILSASKSELPFFITTHDQIDWAREAGINLIVAGFGWDADSNIYTGYNEPMGKLSPSQNPNYLVFKNVTKMHHRHVEKEYTESNDIEYPTIEQIHNVPIFESEDPILELMPHNWTLREFAYEDALAIRRLNPKEGSLLKTLLCAKTLCCFYDVEWTYDDRIIPDDRESLFYSYALVNVRGVYKLMNGSVVSIELCSVMACSGDNLDESCGKRIDPAKSVVHPITFKSIAITRRDIFNLANRITLPLTLTFDGLLAEKDFSFTNNITSYKQTLKLKSAIDELMFFGINTRVFEADQLPADYFDLPKIPDRGDADDDDTKFSLSTILKLIVAALLPVLISCIIYCVYLKDLSHSRNHDDELQQPLSFRFDSDNPENIDLDILGGGDRQGYENEVSRAIDETELAAAAVGNESRLPLAEQATGSLDKTCNLPASSSSADDKTDDISESLASSSLAKSAAVAVTAIANVEVAQVTASDTRKSPEIDSSYFQTNYSSDQGLIGSDSVLTSSGIEQQGNNVQGNEEKVNEGDDLIAIAGESVNVSEGVTISEAIDNDKCNE